MRLIYLNLSQLNYFQIIQANKFFLNVIYIILLYLIQVILENYQNFLNLFHSLIDELTFYIFLNLLFVLLINDLVLQRFHLILILLSIFMNLIFFYFF